MTRIEQLLAESFAMESQANVKYLASAIRADREGQGQAARLFRATAAAAAIHAHNYLLALGPIQSTEKNLLEAIAHETRDVEQIYPEMITIAKTEGHRSGEATSIHTHEVKKFHVQLYQKLLNELGKSQETFSYHVCPICGYTAENEPPLTCPVCGAKGESFKRID